MNTQERFDPDELRTALGRFATGVTIVSTRAADGRPVGVTVNSFGSVSLEPPIVQWSLRKTSPSLAAFDAAGRFVVNVLALDQLTLSRRFASPVPDKFHGVAHRPGRHALPVIEGSAAVFECRLERRLEVGDHILFLGQVEAYEHEPHAALLFHGGQYMRGAGLADEQV